MQHRNKALRTALFMAILAFRICDIKFYVSWRPICHFSYFQNIVHTLSHQLEEMASEMALTFFSLLPLGDAQFAR